MGLQDATRSSFWWILGILTQFRHWVVSQAPCLAFECGFFDKNTGDHAYSASTLSSESLFRPPLGRSPKSGILSLALLSARVSRGVAPAFWCRWSPTYPQSFDGLPALCLSSLSRQLQFPQPMVTGWEPALDRGTMSLFSVCNVLNRHLTTALSLRSAQSMYPHPHALQASHCTSFLPSQRPGPSWVSWLSPGLTPPVSHSLRALRFYSETPTPYNFPQAVEAY